MAVRTDIQYVPYYFEGSAARKLEQKPQQKHAAAPKQRKARRMVIILDPVAIFGAIAAVCMVVALLAGFVQYRQIQKSNQQMQQYIDQLQAENQQLEQTYKDGYDLDEIREIAEALEMIPAEDAQQIQIQVQVPQEEPAEEISLWESFTTFLAGLFA